METRQQCIDGALSEWRRGLHGDMGPSAVANACLGRHGLAACTESELRSIDATQAAFDRKNRAAGDRRSRMGV